MVAQTQKKPTATPRKSAAANAASSPILTTARQIPVFPEPDTWQLSDKPNYVNFVTNETIHGVEWFAPQSVADDWPRNSFLVADMSAHPRVRST